MQCSAALDSSKEEEEMNLATHLLSSPLLRLSRAPAPSVHSFPLLRLSTPDKDRPKAPSLLPPCRPPL